MCSLNAVRIKAALLSRGDFAECPNFTLAKSQDTQSLPGSTQVVSEYVFLFCKAEGFAVGADSTRLCGDANHVEVAFSALEQTEHFR